jgi:hypothetical protein
VDALFAALNHIGGSEPRQVVEPEAGGLGFPVPELPRLDDLIRWPDGGADHAHRIFDAPAWDRCIHQQAHKIERFGLLLLLSMEVARSADGEVSAWRVGDHQIPADVEHLLDGLLQVVARISLTLEQITTPCVMAAAPEGIPHSTAVFAGDQHPHP